MDAFLLCALTRWPPASAMNAAPGRVSSSRSSESSLENPHPSPSPHPDSFSPASAFASPVCFSRLLSALSRRARSDAHRLFVENVSLAVALAFFMRSAVALSQSTSTSVSSSTIAIPASDRPRALSAATPLNESVSIFIPQPPASYVTPPARPRNAPRDGPPVGATTAQHDGAFVFTSAMTTADTTVAVSSPSAKHLE